MVIEPVHGSVCGSCFWMLMQGAVSLSAANLQQKSPSWQISPLTSWTEDFCVFFFLLGRWKSVDRANSPLLLKDEYFRWYSLGVLPSVLFVLKDFYLLFILPEWRCDCFSWKDQMTKAVSNHFPARKCGWQASLTTLLHFINRRETGIIKSSNWPCKG